MKEYKTFMEGKVLEKRRNVVNHRTTEYQYGSAVRKLQSVPEIHTYEHERRIEWSRAGEKTKKKEIRRNNRVNLVYTTVLSVQQQYLQYATSILISSQILRLTVLL